MDEGRDHEAKDLSHVKRKKEESQEGEFRQREKDKITPVRSSLSRLQIHYLAISRYTNILTIYRCMNIVFKECISIPLGHGMLSFFLSFVVSFFSNPRYLP